MNDFARVAAGLFAMIAAPGALAAFAAFAPAPAADRLRLLVSVLVPMLAVLALAAVLSDPFLEGLDVSAESFQTAAGLVMLPLALRLLWSGQRDVSQGLGPLWRSWSLLFGPAPFVAMLSYSGRFGVAMSLEAAVAVLLVSAFLLAVSPWLAARLGNGGCSMLGRANGALIVVMAVELIVDGVQSV